MSRPKTTRSEKRRPRRWPVLLAAVAGLCGLVGTGAAAFGYWRYIAPGPLPVATALVIPHGGYSSTIAVLRNGGALETSDMDAWIFRLAIQLTRHDGQLHAAELEFPAHGSMRDILYVLRHAPPVRHRITIPEGLTAKQIVALVNNAPFLTGTLPALAEGEALPETYDYLRDTTREALIERMRQRMQRALDHVWQNRDPAIGLADPGQLVILASIVEKETAVADERPHVARVFLNRLAQGMKLQSDPTTIYALNDGAGPLGRPLTHADMSVASPFNTYVTAGLPPTPICSPGVATLEAVAHPLAGNDLYFVASGNGAHHFAASLDEHNHNVAALRAARQATQMPQVQDVP